MAPKNPISLQSLGKIPTCYASCSIGSPSESKPLLPEKLRAFSAAGFQQIELSFPDLQAYASHLYSKDVAEDDYDALCSAAKEVRKLCREQQQNLEILVLQPFGNFEGWRKGSKERDDAFARLNGWIRIMEAAGTDMLQVGSSDSDGLAPRDSIVADLQELADILQEKKFRAAYENWCWSSHAPKWKDVYEIMKAVDRSNFGLCLDTFQTAGSELADPTTSTGYIGNAFPNSSSYSDLQSNFENSLEELSSTVPPEKIFFFQISDAYKPPSPLSTEIDDQGLKPRGRWSHYYRPLPFGEGYLPVTQVTKAILRTGYRGPFSTEVFDGGPEGGTEGDLEIEKTAKQAMDAHRQLLKESAEEP